MTGTKLPLGAHPAVTERDGVRHIDFRQVDPKNVPLKFRKPRGASAKLLRPSPALVAIVGDEPITRTRVVGAIWHYIFMHRLQDPADRRTIVADDRLRAVFDADRAGMLELPRILSGHLSEL